MSFQGAKLLKELSKNKVEYQKEWKDTGIIVRDDDQNIPCFCNRKIKNIYIIANKNTNKFATAGSSCIKKFQLEKNKKKDSRTRTLTVGEYTDELTSEELNRIATELYHKVLKEEREERELEEFHKNERLKQLKLERLRREKLEKEFEQNQELKRKKQKLEKERYEKLERKRQERLEQLVKQQIEASQDSCPHCNSKVYNLSFTTCCICHKKFCNNCGDDECNLNDV